MKPFIEIDNFLTDSEFKLVINEINDNLQHFKYQERKKHLHYDRWFIDEHYENQRQNSSILSIIDKALFDRTKKECESHYEQFVFALMPTTDWHETQVTSYSDSMEYEWHIDHLYKDRFSGRIMNWILYLNDVSDGGELEISLDSYSSPDLLPENVNYTIKPKKNKLIIMPSNLLHRVKPTQKKSSIMNSRLSLNGHIGLRKYRLEKCSK